MCKLIKEDIRNNSAWNQRWLVSHRGKQQYQPIGLDVARREADFAIDHGAMLDPYNESPWRYLIGILQEQHQYYQQAQNDNNDDDNDDENKNILKAMIVTYEAKTNSNKIRNVLIDSNRDPDTCINMTNARIDLLEMMGIDDKDSLQTAILLTDGLATKYDTIRKKYWLLVSKRLHRRYSALTVKSKSNESSE